MKHAPSASGRPSTPAPFALVDAIVLGASASGVEALLTILSALSSSFAMPEAAVASAKPQIAVPLNGIVQLIIALGAHRAGGKGDALFYGR